MLLEKPVAKLFSLVGSPVPASIDFIANKTEMHVPVVVVASNGFAPPFIIPGGVWNVVYTIQTPGYVFTSITYKDLPDSPVVKDNENVAGGNSWTTVFDTTGVTFVNKLDANFSLHSLETGEAVPGDPTIAVVPDPMG